MMSSQPCRANVASSAASAVERRDLLASRQVPFSRCLVVTGGDYDRAPVEHAAPDRQALLVGPELAVARPAPLRDLEECPAR